MLQMKNNTSLKRLLKNEKNSSISIVIVNFNSLKYLKK